MISVHRAEDRFTGGDQDAGILTRHAFSFGSFYDPDNLRFGALMACNSERLAPGAGFDEHPHSHTEIVTWVVEGELTHRDSAGHATVVRAGDLQRLGAASGVRHIERNDGDTPLTFIQMWLAPLEPGGEPSYTIVPGLADSTPYALPAAGATLHVRRLDAGSARRCRTRPGCTSMWWPGAYGSATSGARNWSRATRCGSPARRGWSWWRRGRPRC